MGILKYYRLYKNYGFDGLRLNFQLKYSKKNVLKTNIKGLKHPVYIRNKTTDSMVFKQIFRYNEYEYPYSPDPKVIIDLGANTGLSSLYFHNKFPKAKLIALEPEQSNYKMLLINTEHYENINTINKAIWKKSGFVEIKNIGRGEWGFVVEESETKTMNSIESVSMDQLVEEYSINSIDVLKIDIEGAERDLFSGNCDVWLRKVKLLIIEVHDNIRPGCAKSLFNALSGFDYLYGHNGENIFITIK